MTVSNTNDEKFSDDVLKSSKPVLVDFWAEWCGPCKAIAPSLDEISKEMDNKLKVIKLNIDENPNISQEYNIRSIPALMIFKNSPIKYKEPVTNNGLFGGIFNIAF